MAWRVQERDFLAVAFDLIRTDMLGDATGLTISNLGFPDFVEQRCLAVIDMAHDRDNRRARLHIFRLSSTILRGSSTSASETRTTV